MPRAWTGPPPGAVDCIRLFPDRLSPSDLAALAGLLSRDELRRAESFARDADHCLAIASRACLRRLIARCVSADPRDLVFETEPRGKPRLAGAPPFNLCHADGIILIAIAAGGLVGVDVEGADAGEAWRDLSDRLHADERRAVAAARSRDRGRAFLRLWTRKEAMAKALGLGMFALDPASWTTPDGPPGAGGAGAWTFVDLTPARGRVGALAATGVVRPRFWTFATEA